MKCSRASRLISDYIDGNLDAKRRSDLEQHLKSCANCQKLLEDFEGIVEKAQELEDHEPSSLSWLKIKTRLETETEPVQTLTFGRRKWFNFILGQPMLKYALSAALILAIVVGAVTLGVRTWKGTDLIRARNNPQYTLAKLEEAERHYQQASKALADAFASQKESLSPDVAKVLQAHLEIVDFSIEACRRAIFRDPNNIEVHNYLLFAYSKKIELLGQMVAIQSVSSREREADKTL